MKRSRILLAGVAIAALAGCTQLDETIQLADRSYREIKVEEVTVELKLGGAGAAERLGDDERSAVAEFAAMYDQDGHGPVIISRPSNGPNDVAALRAATDARAILLSEGVPSTKISEGTYDGSGARNAPLLISYRAYEAKVPGCPDLSSVDMATATTNTALPSFGCAVNSNLAAMIAHPSDAMRSQKLDPSDAGRRLIQFTKYRAGEKTGATEITEASTSFSGN